MPSAPPRASFGVAAYSFPFGCGFLARAGEPRPPAPDAWALIDLAAAHGLSSVELPLAATLADTGPATIVRLRAALAQHGLGLVADTGVVDLDDLAAALPLAAAAGARTVRAVVSPILEGERARLAGGWDAHLAAIGARLAAARPLLERHDLTLALENHQDATADDLLALCAAGGERVGVTFDVVNPLAVAEDPARFVHTLGPRIRNVHLKDYQIYPTESGYRLVRCALGEGVIDWPAMLALLDAAAPGAPLHIELAALYGRHIRLLEDDWWAHFPPRPAHAIIPALRLLSRNARPADEEWRTPWELGRPAAEVLAWEREQFARSVAFLRALGR
jgi:sugar phosphate isomerase/epimerase